MTRKSKNSETISKSQEDRILGILWRRLLKWHIGSFCVLTLISIFGLIYGITKAYIEGTKKLESILIDNISREFQTSKIKNTVEEVAKNQANEILITQVNPEVAQFKSQTGDKVLKFEDFLVDLKQRYETDYQLLSSEVAKLKQRNEITATAGENLSIGPVYLNKDGKYYRAKSDSYATMPAVAISTTNIKANETGIFATGGQMTNPAWTWMTPGAPLYVSDITAGILTETQPGSGHIAQRIARVRSATSIEITSQQPMVGVP